MMLPSMGQTIAPSEMIIPSSAIERSGTTHITPTTWQKANKSTSVIQCVFVREIIRPVTFLTGLSLEIGVIVSTSFPQARQSDRPTNEKHQLCQREIERWLP